MAAAIQELWAYWIVWHGIEGAVLDHKGMLSI
jgi:hypothetical protein